MLYVTIHVAVKLQELFRYVNTEWCNGVWDFVSTVPILELFCGRAASKAPLLIKMLIIIARLG